MEKIKYTVIFLQGKWLAEKISFPLMPGISGLAAYLSKILLLFILIRPNGFLFQRVMQEVSIVKSEIYILLFNDMGDSRK